MAASMAAVLLCAGVNGKRSALKHSRIMIHQPMGGAQGQASDIQIVAREIEKLKKELYEIIAYHSGNPFDKVEKEYIKKHLIKQKKQWITGWLTKYLIEIRQKNKIIYNG